MSILRYSLAGLFLVVTAVAVVLVFADRYLWVFGLTIQLALIGMLLLSLPLVLYARAAQRPFWRGFALCSWAFFICFYVPNAPKFSQLNPTTTLLMFIQAGASERIFASPSSGKFGWSGPSLPSDETLYQVYMGVSHLVLAVLVGYFGGTVAAALAKNCEDSS